MENKNTVNKFIKMLPNILSGSRLFLAILLTIFSFTIMRKNGELNQIVYSISVVLLVIAMFTDFLDGKISRAFSVTSELGSLLDHVADIVLVFCIVIFAFIGVQVQSSLTALQMEITVYIIIALFTLKIFTTIFPIFWCKVKRSGMHTYFNKSWIVITTLLFLFFILYKEIVWGILLAIEAYAVIAFGEELFLIFYDKDYDVNRKGLIFDKPRWKPWVKPKEEVKQEMKETET